MNNIEIAEKTIASLTDKRDRAAQRSTDIAAERQQLGFDVHVTESKEAKAQLSLSRRALARLCGRQGTLAPTM
jgi:hypothetical protein